MLGFARRIAGPIICYTPRSPIRGERGRIRSPFCATPSILVPQIGQVYIVGSTQSGLSLGFLLFVLSIS